MRFALVAAVLLGLSPAWADVFSDQLEQLRRYHEREIAQAKKRPELLRERLGAVDPVLGAAQVTLVAEWPGVRIEELRVAVEPGHFADALVLTPVGAKATAVIAVAPDDVASESWTPRFGDAIVCVPLTAQRTKDHPLSESTRGKDRRHILHRLAFVTGRTLTGLEVTEVRGLAQWLRKNRGVREVGLWGGSTALYAAAVDPGFTALTYLMPGGPEPVDRTIYGSAYLDMKPKLPPIGAELSVFTPGDPLVKVENEERRNRHYNDLLDFLRARIRASAAEREARHHLTSSAPQQAVPKLLADLRAVMGEVPEASVPMNPRLTKIGETASYRAFDVWIDVLPGVEAYGQLLVPNERGGQRLPAVVTQHGLGGKPGDLTLQAEKPNAAYHGYAARLAEHGYVVFAPYVTVPIPQAELINPLVRMANELGRMRTNIEVAKLRRIVDFLQDLPYVDPNRLGYYGLSYGGYSTIWMGPLEPRFRATVVSGHFNDWTPKITNETERTSYLQHPDEDFYNWNVLNRLTHVELLAAFWPRAVMVEFAQHDGTTFPAWHQKAWDEVMRVAKAWNATDRIVRDRFVGIHEIHGIGAFDFLDRWLRPEVSSSREFANWGTVTQRLDGNSNTWVRGSFHVGTKDPRFRGLAFRVKAEGQPGALTVRYGSTAGAADWGEVTARIEGDWAVARVPVRTMGSAATIAAEPVRVEGAPNALAGGRPANRTVVKANGPARELWFELRAGPSPAPNGYVLTGPKPLGGSRFPQDFAVAYRPLADR